MSLLHCTFHIVRDDTKTEFNIKTPATIYKAEQVNYAIKVDLFYVLWPRVIKIAFFLKWLTHYFGNPKS